MEGTKFVLAMIYHQSVLTQIPLIEFDLNNTNEASHRWWEKRFNKLRNRENYLDGHRMIRLTMRGYLHCFSIHPSKTEWEICIWDETGNTTVINIKFPLIDRETDKMSNEIYNKIIAACENFRRGTGICSCCKQELKLENIAGRYFAGIYCSHCWETKYKAIEAAETYE